MYHGSLKNNSKKNCQRLATVATKVYKDKYIMIIILLVPNSTLCSYCRY